MPPEAWPIIDTAVKVGLGALIGGVATYYVAKLTHEKQYEREKAAHEWQTKTGIDARKREMLEEVASQVEIFFNAMMEVAFSVRMRAGQPLPNSRTPRTSTVPVGRYSSKSRAKVEE